MEDDEGVAGQQQPSGDVEPARHLRCGRVGHVHEPDALVGRAVAAFVPVDPGTRRRVIGGLRRGLEDVGLVDALDLDVSVGRPLLAALVPPAGAAVGDRFDDGLDRRGRLHGLRVRRGPVLDLDAVRHRVPGPAGSHCGGVYLAAPFSPAEIRPELLGGVERRDVGRIGHIVGRGRCSVVGCYHVLQDDRADAAGDEGDGDDGGHLDGRKRRGSRHAACYDIRS